MFLRQATDGPIRTNLDVIQGSGDSLEQEMGRRANEGKEKHRNQDCGTTKDRPLPYTPHYSARVYPWKYMNYRGCPGSEKDILNRLYKWGKITLSGRVNQKTQGRDIATVHNQEENSVQKLRVHKMAVELNKVAQHTILNNNTYKCSLRIICSWDSPGKPVDSRAFLLRQRVCQEVNFSPRFLHAVSVKIIAN